MNQQMRFMIGALILVFCLALVSGSNIHNETDGNQTNWFVNVYDGWGFGTGDQQLHQPDDEEDEPRQFIKKIDEEISVGDKFLKDNYARDINEDVDLSSDLNNKNTAKEPKEPINWTPIILWGMVIIFTIALIFGVWYIYQIYFY